MVTKKIVQFIQRYQYRKKKEQLCIKNVCLDFDPIRQNS